MMLMIERVEFVCDVGLANVVDAIVGQKHRHRRMNELFQDRAKNLAPEEEDFAYRRRYQSKLPSGCQTAKQRLQIWVTCAG